MNTFREKIPLVSLEEAFRRIQAQIPERTDLTEVIPSGLALGRVLAEDVFAKEDLPAYRKSTMDGYALCGAAGAAGYELIGEVRMGSADALRLEAGQAAYVPTGGRLPEGAQSVLKVEGAALKSGRLQVADASALGNHWIDRGEDIRVNAQALVKGQLIGPLSLGFLSLLGVPTVTVCRRLKVAVITTGDELIEPFGTERADSGKIRDINLVVLQGLAREKGCEIVMAAQVPDEREQVEAAILKAANLADLVITSGASSMGKADVIPDILESHSQGLIFHGLNVKPGKPVGLARIGEAAVLALPGNPVSSAMTFVVVAEKLIAQLTGQTLERIRVSAMLKEKCQSQEGKTTLIPVKLERAGGEFFAQPILGKSGLISIVASADGFLSIAPGEALERGEVVEITLF